MPEKDPLDDLLVEWKAPAAPASLERRVFPRRSLWDWLLGGAIRVPVPVALALVVALVAGAFLYFQRPAPMPATNSAGNSAATAANFEPVKEIKPRIIRRDP